MPTAAKLVAALFFAALGWFCADLVKPQLPEGTQALWFSPVSAAWGLIVGWTFCGRRIVDRDATGPTMGLTTVLLMVFWVLLSFSGTDMIRFSLRKRYDGPVEALQSMFEIAIDYLKLAATPEVIGALVVGGLIGGFLTKAASQRWS